MIAAFALHFGHKVSAELIERLVSQEPGGAGGWVGRQVQLDQDTVLGLRYFRLGDKVWGGTFWQSIQSQLK